MLHQMLLTLVLLGLPFVSDELPGSTVLDVTPLSEWVGEADMRHTLLAPDGSAVAWFDRQTVCTYVFETEATRCVDMPEDSDISFTEYNPPLWSSDSRRIYMHPDYIVTLREPDLWSLDVASGEFTNLTDDGVRGSLISASDDGDVAVDFGMAIHPATGELYFLRLAMVEGEFSLSNAHLWLMKLTAEGEAEVLRDLTADVPDVASLPWSPAFIADGNQLAFAVFPIDWHENPATGVATLDLTTGQFEQVADLETLQQAVPAWSRDSFLPGQIEAAAGGVVVWMRNSARGGPPMTPVFVDTATGEATSLIDYSGIADADGLRALREETDEISVYSIPFTGRVRPDGEAFWLVTVDTDERMGLFEIPLPPADAAPVLLASFTHHWNPGFQVAPTFSEDGKLLVQDVLLTLEMGE